MPAVWEMVRILPPEAIVNSKVPVPGQTGAVPPLSEQTGVFPSLSTEEEKPRPQEKKFLAILVPHTGEVTTEWAYKFRNLPLPQGTHILMSKGQPVDITRDQMAKTMVKEGYEWLFFLDSDIVLPDDVFAKLFSHGKLIVAGLYRARQHGGFVWGAWTRIKMPEGSGRNEAFSPLERWMGRVISCDVTGCGCMLVHRSVFEKIQEKYPKLPWFFWTNNRAEEFLNTLDVPDPMMKDVSEDFWFCLLAKKCGFEILVDTDVKCGHLSMVKIVETGIVLPGA